MTATTMLPETPAIMTGPFGFTFHQVAMYTNSQTDAIQRLMDLGYLDWTYDTAVLHGERYVGGQWRPVETLANMAFNYQVMPMELEFLTYDGQSDHRHQERARLSAVPFISHMSVHVDSVVETMRTMLEEHSMTPCHAFVTHAHTNPHIAGVKRFVECIYDMRADLGYDIKCIERIAVDSKMPAYAYLRDAGIV